MSLKSKWDKDAGKQMWLEGKPDKEMIMLKTINLENKCGSCDHFRQMGDTAQGECLQNPYGETVVHDPKHPHWIVQRSRIKCRLYNAKPQTNADR